MNNEKQLPYHIQNFFQDYLTVQRGLSPNTILSYRDTIKLLLNFIKTHLKKNISKLTLSDLTAEHVLSFLKDVEESRGNKVKTRNNRLAALRTFFSYLAAQDPTRSNQYCKIIAIPIKKSAEKPMHYLEVREVKCILDSIGQKTALDRRDYAILTLLHNTGMRVQEICDLRVQNVRLEAPILVSVTGKGKKIREIPIWKETAAILKHYMAERGIMDNLKERIFISKTGTPLNRFSLRRMIQRRTLVASKTCPGLIAKNVTPHTFRHTTAMHLLQSNVDLTVIKTWLGHVNLSTTHSYVEIDLDMKREALSACTPIGDAQGLKKVVEKSKDIIDWLTSLSNPHPLCELNSTGAPP